MNEHAKHRTSRAVQHRDGAEESARAAQLRRSGWMLGLLAIGFYLGFIAWNVLRTAQLG